MSRKNVAMGAMILLGLAIGSGYLRRASGSDRQTYAEDILYDLLRKDKKVGGPTDALTVCAGQVKGSNLGDIVLVHRNEKGVVDFVAKARNATLRVNVETRELTICMRSGQCVEVGGEVTTFDYREISGPLPDVVCRKLGL